MVNFTGYTQYKFTLGQSTEEAFVKRLCEVHPDTNKKLSSRLYEFFFMEYLKHVKCLLDNKDIAELFTKATNGLKKKQFTFFRRACPANPKFIVVFGNLSINTNIAQLRFLDWVAINEIDRYIIDHFDEILQKKKYGFNSEETSKVQYIFSQIPKQIFAQKEKPEPPKISTCLADTQKSYRIRIP